MESLVCLLSVVLNNSLYRSLCLNEYDQEYVIFAVFIIYTYCWC